MLKMTIYNDWIPDKEAKTIFLSKIKIKKNYTVEESRNINLVQSFVSNEARVGVRVKLKAGSHGTRVFSIHVPEVSRHSCKATET